MKIDALLDSNVVIAMLAEGHEHNAASLAMLTGGSKARFAVAAHSYAESYCTLTRRGDHAPFRFSPEEAWAALESVRAVTALIGLTASQSFEVIGRYARTGGIGARLYDCLIGETAVAHGVPVIVTWNIGHMCGRFLRQQVVTPEEFGEGLS